MASKTLRWMLGNKLLVIFAVLVFCLFISTVVLAAQNVKLKRFVKSNNMQKMAEKHIDNRGPTTDAQINYYRLPKYVKPTNYQLTLWPNLSKKTFQGNVTISFQVLEPTKAVSLHSKDLTINCVTLTNEYNQSIPITSKVLITTVEILEINLLKKIIPNIGLQIHIMFSGRLDKGIVGFYESSTRNGNTMVASKFQPTYARQAFPCFDEPEFKATYDITLVKPLDYVALSNMNEVSKVMNADSNSEAVTFATSVPMSTYLACFVICNFDYKKDIINTYGIGEHFILRSFAQKDQMHKIDFAQDIGKRVTEYYIKYYEVPFPLPKLDMIAIPDYVSGATEHWGLITYRETSFLIDETTASSRNKISVANTVAHELAHMWFGNLVTMKWWDEVWLNEGFASYMQVKSLNAVEPSWTMLDQFLTKTLHSVLVTDARQSSHPIVQTVETPDQITAIFDSISYNKGASVLRMLEGFIGEENFRKGVSDYLKKYKFGNTVTKDLLLCLEPYFKKEHPNLNLLYIMDTWTKQTGYPLINIQPGDKENTYIITQKRFLIDSKSLMTQHSEYGYRWFVPITYKMNGGIKENILWFPDISDSVTLSVGEGEKWLKINNNQVGYYRVNYTPSMWGDLTEQLKNNNQQLTISDRANLLDDVFALAEANIIKYEIALNLSTYLAIEKDFVPWEAASAIFDKLSHNILNTDAYENLQNYVQYLVKSLYAKLSWEKSELTIIESLLRTRIFSLATNYQLPDAETKVRNIFLSWLTSPNASKIEPDLRDFVYYFGMKAATQEEWNKLWEIYLKEDDVQEQTKIRAALSAPRDVEILKRYLQLAWDENNIRSQDYLNVLGVVSSNPNGTDLVWDNVRENWLKLVDRFTLNSRYLGSLVPSVTSTFNTEKRLKEMQAFFEQYPEAGAGEMSRVRAIENVQNNINWKNSHLNSVSSWLKDQLKKI